MLIILADSNMRNLHEIKAEQIEENVNINCIIQSSTNLSPNMNEEERDYAIRPNKEELKREHKALHSLGRELVELPESLFATIPLSERIKDQIFAAKKFKKAALQRQLRFISSLMLAEDTDAIREALRLIKLPHKKDVEQFHQLETWRDQLIAGDNAVFAEILDAHPSANRQHINQLIRNTAKEAKQNKPPKSSRVLFKYLQTLQKNQGE